MCQCIKHLNVSRDWRLGVFLYDLRGLGVETMTFRGFCQHLPKKGVHIWKWRCNEGGEGVGLKRENAIV